MNLNNVTQWDKNKGIVRNTCTILFALLLFADLPTFISFIPSWVSYTYNSIIPVLSFIKCRPSEHKFSYRMIILLFIVWLFGDIKWSSFWRNPQVFLRPFLAITLLCTFSPHIFSFLCRIIADNIYIILGIACIALEGYCLYVGMNWTVLLHLAGTLLLWVFYIRSMKNPK